MQAPSREETARPIVPPASILTPSATLEAVEDRGVTGRIVVLCLGLAILFGYVIPIIDVRLSNTFLGAQQLPPGAIGALLVFLLILNPLVRLLCARPGARHLMLVVSGGFAFLAWARWGSDSVSQFVFLSCAVLAFTAWAMGKRPFSRNEALTLYITSLFSTMVPGHGAETYSTSTLTAPFYFATRENKWLDYLQTLPWWYTPALSDKQGYSDFGKSVVEGWYSGLRPGQEIPWGAWIIPLCAWSALILALYAMLCCFSVMLRAQWAEREALQFPLLRLPLELTEDLNRPDTYGILGRFFRNPIMWMGFTIAVVIQAINGLNFYFPDVPIFVTNFNTAPMLSEPPWNQIGGAPIYIWPIAIGIAFLLTSEVSFSLWFFYWFIKFQLIFAFLLGFMPAVLPNAAGSGNKIFILGQVIGAYFAYAAIVLWTAREHLGHVVRRAFGRAKATDMERTEMMSYPAAFWGFLLAFGFCVAWFVAIGVRLDLALGMWAIYLIIAVGLTRLVVEGGMLYVAPGWVPLSFFAQWIGAGKDMFFSPAVGTTPAALAQNAMMSDLRGFIMPSFMQSFKLAHDRQIAQKPLLALIAVICVIGVAMGFYMRVKLGYEYGALGFHTHFAKNGPQNGARNMKELSDGVKNVAWFNWVWPIAGAAMVYFCMFARSRFLGFPLHPIGFLICLAYPASQFWFSIMLGWAAKVLITKFFGTDTYRKVTPGFLGLVMGDVTMMLLWLVVDGWQGRTNHYLVPT